MDVAEAPEGTGQAATPAGVLSDRNNTCPRNVSEMLGPRLSAPTSGRGRPTHWIHGYYKRLEKLHSNSWRMQCKTCNKEITGRNDKLEKHILSECQGLGIREVRQEANRKKASMQDSTDEVDPSATIACSQQSKAPGNGGSRKKQRTLHDVVDMRQHGAQQTRAIHHLLLLMIVMGGLAFQLVDNPHFQAFTKALAPNYELPGGHGC